MRNLFIFVVVLLTAACTRTHDEVVVNMDAPQTTKISKEQALKNLYSELKIIDGTTRSDGSSRSVKSIKELKGAVTRSGDALANDLLYIVEFEEGQGSAVVAADTRLDPVIAVLDSSVITEEDFSSTNTEDIGVYMASMISDYANNTVSVASSGFLPAPGHTAVDTIYDANISPLLKTKWDQSSPYNDLCANNNGTNTAAGCATIAIAQFAYYHKSPNVINGYNVNWSILSNCEYKAPTLGGTIIGGGSLIGGGTIGSESLIQRLANAEVARFVYNIGVLIGLDYANGDSGASSYEMSSCLSALGYSCTLTTYNLSAVKNLVGSNKPVVMIGYCDEGGHAWVIDGWKDYVIRTTTASEVEGEVGTVEPEYTITEVYYDKIHCNFGWKGKCDGYYTGDIFNCSKTNNDIEPGIGDTPYTTPYNFDYGLSYFSY